MNIDQISDKVVKISKALEVATEQADLLMLNAELDRLLLILVKMSLA